MSRGSRDEEFTQFVAARQHHLRRVAYACCGDWHRADDLLQTALVKLYVAWPRIQRHWLGLSVAETAAELRISEGTVKSHSSRGLERLQRELTTSP